MSSIKLRRLLRCPGSRWLRRTRAADRRTKKRRAAKKAASGSKSAIAPSSRNSATSWRTRAPRSCSKSRARSCGRPSVSEKRLAGNMRSGLGPGVVKGAYVRMPRYFADADQVMDVERRIVHCMVTLQDSSGGSRQETLQQRIGHARPGVAGHYVAAQSRGMKIAVPQKHPRSAKPSMWVRNIPLPRRRLDFSCASCHGEDGKRIRTQDLPISVRRRAR